MKTILLLLSVFLVAKTVSCEDYVIDKTVTLESAEKHTSSSNGQIVLWEEELIPLPAIAGVLGGESMDVTIRFDPPLCLKAGHQYGVQLATPPYGIGGVSSDETPRVFNVVPTGTNLAVSNEPGDNVMSLVVDYTLQQSGVFVTADNLIIDVNKEAILKSLRFTVQIPEFLYDVFPTEPVFGDVGLYLFNMENIPVASEQEAKDYPSLISACDPAKKISDIATELDRIDEENPIPKGLFKKLEKAADAYEGSTGQDFGVVVSKLEAFANAVEAQRGKKINDEDADLLLDLVASVIDLL